MGSAPGKLVEFEQALEIVLREAKRVAPRASEFVPLLSAAGRVLAEDVVADRDQPAFNRSTRDGFALRASDAGATLTVAGQIRAGATPEGRLAEGSAVEIMTGAALPEGADAVVMVEHVVVDGKTIRLAAGRTIAAGENVVPRGAEARAGDVLLTPGTRVGAAEIALAASCGYARLSVYAQPKVAIVSTGDELVELVEVALTPGPHQIRNSNSYAIAAMVASAGGIPGRLQIARDLRQEVWERIAQGRTWDLLVLSGGVSMGEYDLVEEVLAEFGAEFFFTGVQMQPGKPVVFGRLPARQHHPLGTPEPECYFFGLPGNPISTQVTFHCFVEMFVRALAGESIAGPNWAQATLTHSVAAKAGLTRLLPARMSGIAVALVGWQGSGDLAANARANCYAEFLPSREYAAGDVIRVLLR
jgi:molybdopterin molybdotransferase